MATHTWTTWIVLPSNSQEKWLIEKIAYIQDHNIKWLSELVDLVNTLRGKLWIVEPVSEWQECADKSPSWLYHIVDRQKEIGRFVWRINESIWFIINEL